MQDADIVWLRGDGRFMGGNGGIEIVRTPQQLTERTIVFRARMDGDGLADMQKGVRQTVGL